MHILKLILFFIATLAFKLCYSQDVKPMLDTGKKLVAKIDDKCKHGANVTDEHMVEIMDLCIKKYIDENSTFKWPKEFVSLLDCWGKVDDEKLEGKGLCDTERRKKGVQCSMGKLFAKMTEIRKFYKDNKDVIDKQFYEAKDCGTKYIDEKIKP